MKVVPHELQGLCQSARAAADELASVLGSLEPDVTRVADGWSGAAGSEFNAAEWLDSNVAGAQAHLIEGEEHVSRMQKAPAILEALRRQRHGVKLRRCVVGSERGAVGRQ
ncbi:WXG100 family type VII secretion target [Rhodococcus sp. KRD197]|uniref:WXG100 family type VII secretion target n=1 Tax=unclassified Rhodococcus (in: high G+C Gram-positive bacteria) TaxID=192944 RepID=UPI003D160DA8